MVPASDLRDVLIDIARAGAGHISSEFALASLEPRETVFHKQARKHRERREGWIAKARAETNPELRAASIAFARAAHLSFLRQRRLGASFRR